MQYLSALKTYVFPHFGRLRLDEIRRRQFIATFDPIWRVKHATAKRTLGRVKDIFELAKVLEYVEMNPADFSPQVAFGPVRKEIQHRTALDWERVPDLWRWLVTFDAEKDVRQMMMMVMVMVMVLSGKRTKEVRFMSWDNLDMAAGIWTKAYPFCSETS